MKFNTKEIKLLEQLCKEYIKTKELVSKAEDIDRNSGANIQINKEFRDALSHLVRILGDILLVNGKKKKQESDYYAVNIDKAIGHIYRAGYDAIDGIAISLRENINILSQFHASVITQVIPDYAEKIERLDLFHESLVKHKQNKDIGNGSSKAFKECIKEMDDIKSSMLGLNKAISMIREIQDEINKDKRFTLFQGIVLTILGAIFGAIVGVLLV